MSDLLLCGYKCSGKDSVYEDIIHESFHDNWKVYSVKGNTDDIQFANNTKYRRVAFADKLKRSVLSKYNLDPSISKEYIIPSLECTYRELLIKESNEAVKTDPYVWAKSALAPYMSSTHTVPICITDWRYPHEYTYLSIHFMPSRPDVQLLTARVVRPVVVIPDPSDMSEHSLDYFQTDIVIVPKELEDFSTVTDMFPQYKYYKLVETRFI